MYSFTEEQLQLRESVRRFLEDQSTTKRTRELMDNDANYDAITHRSLLNDLGIGGIHVPEQYGGAGLSYVELGIVLEEMGRNLYPSPYLTSNVFAINALLLAGSEEQKSEYVPRLVTGDLISTVALYEESNQVDLFNLTTRVHNNRYSGTKKFVANAADADLVILLAPNETDEVGFWFAQLPDDQVKLREIKSLDSTRPLSEMSFEDLPVEPLTQTKKSSYATFIDLALIAVANEMVGGAQALLDSAVDYAKNRVQFGRPIGSMQAIKHKCADLLLDVELAKSSAYRASQAVKARESNLSEFASIAKVAANDAFMQAAKDTIQVHGGIGFTWENDTHLWYRRAKSSEVFLGDSSLHRQRFLIHHLMSNGEA